MGLRITARLLAATVSLVAQVALAGPVSIRLSGRTAASAELRNDILKTIALYGSAFDCPAPSDVRIGSLNASAISPNASFYSPALGTAYEEWDATFCGKPHRFLVTFAPDPRGGTFLSVGYPYPEDAPTAAF